jgi:hypothetical protein
VKFLNVSSVKKGPGAMQLTVMPNGPRSSALARVRPNRALLVAEYTLRSGIEVKAKIDEM